VYSKKSGLILGFHGCCKTIQTQIINNPDENLIMSTESYDWLGHGAYFWEYSYERALQWAVDSSKKPKSKIKEPAVIGAVIDLGNCFDLLDVKYLKLLRLGYDTLVQSLEKSGEPLPQNKPFKDSADLLLRHLDCACIESVHNLNKTVNEKPFDSVRGAFFEGDELYPTAGFKEKNHIQISIINPECIKGYFIPRNI
jgi:hypothetical protein